MSYVIWGTGKHSVDAYTVLKNNNIDVRAFADRDDSESIGTTLEGLEVVALSLVRDRLAKGELKGIILTSGYNSWTRRAAVNAILNVGIDRDSILVIPINFLGWGGEEPELPSEEDPILVHLDDLVQIEDLLWMIEKDCNLNCRGCCLAVGISNEKGGYDLGQFKREVDRLTELVPNIRNISLLGGEPFLNADICEYAEYAREKYPHAKICITTNGVNLFTIPGETFERLREADATIKLSVYPPLRDRLEEMKEVFTAHRMKLVVAPVEQFGKWYSKKPIFTREEGLAKCDYPCVGIKDGYISRCIFSQCVEHINRRFGTSLPENKGTYIFDQTMSGRKLMEAFRIPLDLCMHCMQGAPIETHEWRRSKGDDLPEDYFVD